MKKTVTALIVARQGSSRFPKKATLTLGGKSLLEFLILRLKSMEIFDSVMLATSYLPQDEELIQIARQAGALTFAGDPEDVLKRMADASRELDSEWVVEVGGDCPLVDRSHILRGLEIAERESADYVCNVSPQTYPDGLDIHIVKRTSLLEADRKAVLSSQRLHPFSYFYKHPELFRCHNFEHSTNLSHIRLTLDYAEDYEVIKSVVERIDDKGAFGLDEILALLKSSPEIFKLNANRNLHQSSSNAPAYWYTAAYIQDLLNDLEIVAKLARNWENNRDFSQLKVLYKDLETVSTELRERAETFENLEKKHPSS